MHVVFRESHGLEESDAPRDLGQTPGDLVVLSFSDSDLSAFRGGWHRARAEGRPLPSLRLANLAALTHPVSVDTYAETTLQGAKAVLVRLIGGQSYWAYGLARLRELADRQGLVLAVLPGDGRPDPALEAISTVPRATLARLNALAGEGGAVAAEAALAQLALAAGFYVGPVAGEKRLPPFGCWTPARGAKGGTACETCAAGCPGQRDARPLAAVVFYRAYLAAADTAPVEALMAALEARGFRALGLFAPSLKEPDAARWLAARIAALAPAAIVNATAFSGKGAEGTSPLDAGGVPVFQVALSTATRQAWEEAPRGLSPADLAMHVVLPEVDGRLFAGVASFKAPGDWDADCQIAVAGHAAHEDRVEAIAARVAAWVRLGATPVARRRVALVLSTYPGKDWQMAHAVGLDALASAGAILRDLSGAGYGVEAQDTAFAATLAGDGAAAPEGIRWPLDAYRAALQNLPETLRADLAAAWGDPEDDPDAADGAFAFAAERHGTAIIALQPERGTPGTRADDYHDLSRTPRHAYVAFYLWLRTQADALVHIGAHGTLEWLPGKAVALSDACWPEALTGAMPVIYPFIVNDPGEAAQAKRRIGAVTLGHVPPPLAMSKTPDRLARLEALLDEFSNADGLDPRRRDRLQSDIRAEASAVGVEDDLGLDRAASTAEAITRIDRFVCDVKESQFGDGLHVWGNGRRGRPSVRPFSPRSTAAASIPAPPVRPIAAAPTSCPRAATFTPPTPAPCRRERPMPRASGWPRSWSAAIFRTRATGRVRWSSISGGRQPCARRARSSQWRCT